MKARYSMLELILFRHAKTQPARATEHDHDRRLTPRGWDDAPRVARALYSIGARPDIILTSDAQRCIDTLEAIKEVFGDIPSRAMAQLYLAEPQIIYNTAVTHADASHCRSVMIIGHNPGIHDLASQLADLADGETVRNLRSNFPTSASACFRRTHNDDPWTLHTFLTAKDLRPGDSPEN